MFEVRIMVEDKNLGKVMWSLDGLVAGMPQVIPVRGAKMFRGRVVSAQKGTIVDNVAQVLMQLQKAELSNKEIMDIAIKAGSSNMKAAAQIPYYLAKKGIVKRVGPRRYKVNKS